MYILLFDRKFNRKKKELKKLVPSLKDAGFIKITRTKKKQKQRRKMNYEITSLVKEIIYFFFFHFHFNKVYILR